MCTFSVSSTHNSVCGTEERGWGLVIRMRSTDWTRNCSSIHNEQPGLPCRLRLPAIQTLLPVFVSRPAICFLFCLSFLCWGSFGYAAGNKFMITNLNRTCLFILSTHNITKLFSGQAYCFFVMILPYSYHILSKYMLISTMDMEIFILIE